MEGTVIIGHEEDSFDRKVEKKIGGGWVCELGLVKRCRAGRKLRWQHDGEQVATET
jgi:hypothetical protein